MHISTRRLRTLIKELSNRFSTTFLRRVRTVINISLTRSRVTLIMFNVLRVQRRFPNFFKQGLLRRHNIRRHLALVIRAAGAVSSINSVQNSRQHTSIPAYFYIFHYQRPYRHSLDQTPSAVQTALWLRQQHQPITPLPHLNPYQFRDT